MPTFKVPKKAGFSALMTEVAQKHHYLVANRFITVEIVQFVIKHMIENVAQIKRFCLNKDLFKLFKLIEGLPHDDAYFLISLNQEDNSRINFILQNTNMQIKNHNDRLLWVILLYRSYCKNAS